MPFPATLRKIAAQLRRPELMVFLPALTLAAFWLGGEEALIVTALCAPLLFALAGAFRFADPAALAETIANGQQGGRLYPDLDATAAAWHILDLWHGASTRALALRDDSAPRAAIVHLEAWLKP